MTGAHVIIGLVSEGTAREALAAAIEGAGATFEMCTESTVLAKGGDVDAIIFDVGSTPELHGPVATALATDPRTRWVPRLLLVGGDLTAERIAPFGVAMVLPAAADQVAMTQAIAHVVEEARARSDLARAAAARHADLRVAESDLLALQKEGDTLSHDARVLFGVIMGYASNLRDGIAGPVVDLQRAHAANIAEAAADAAALLERYVAALRRTVREPAQEQTEAQTSASPRRRQNDLAELVRTTVSLFAGIAAAKRIRLEAVAPRAVLAWCDAMQVKQVLVNLLANALKFTPPDGVVEVAVGPGAPASAHGGGSPRREVEIVVSDSGPGIPEPDRERMFERGVRLGRDSLVPGTGLGLAVVRDIVELHGGVVRIDSTHLGGASLVLTLPADLRARAADQRVRAVTE